MTNDSSTNNISNLSNTSSTSSAATTTPSNSNKTKIQALKSRKCELEKILFEKNLLLQQLQKQEAKIINQHITDWNFVENLTTNNNLRRKIGGTSFKLSKTISTNEDDNNFLLDKKAQREICNNALKLANDPRHKIDLVQQQQQKLLAQNILKRQSSSVGQQQQQLLTKVNLSGSANTINTLKRHESDNKNNNNNNNSNNGSIFTDLHRSFKCTDRRNSIKSTTGYYTNQDIYDLKLLKAKLNENERQLSPKYCDNVINLQQYNQMIDYIENFNSSNNNHQHLSPNQNYFTKNVNLPSPNGVAKSPTMQSDKYYFSPTQQQYDDNTKNGGGFIKASQNIRPTTHLLRDDLQKMTNFENCSEVETISTYNPIRSGLGGHWKTSCHNERIWCSTDTYEPDHFSKPKGSQQQSKSSSLSSFDIINPGRNDVDQLSISSVNSDTNKSKPKEKQWMETSLDGPIIRVKQQHHDLRATASLYNYSMSPLSSHRHMNNNNSPSPISFTHNNDLATTVVPTTTFVTPPTISKPYQQRGAFRERSKLSSKSMSNGTCYRMQSIVRLEDLSHLSHSTSILNSTESYNDDEDEQILTTDPDTNCNVNGLPSPYSLDRNITHHIPKKLTVVPSSITYNLPPIMQQKDEIALQKITDIRIESPKNMTVIQQATFMPYKEVSKPFEMSDFYKYSTKFRQSTANGQLAAQYSPVNSINNNG